MRILILGSGAREHAIARALVAEHHDVVVAPGNAGIAQLAEVRPVDAADPAAATELALGVGAELVVVGPEAPLVAGVADALRAQGLPVFGPDADAARIEGSKASTSNTRARASSAAEIGRSRNTIGSPREITSARRRFSSISRPSTKPSSSGANGEI